MKKVIDKDELRESFVRASADVMVTTEEASAYTGLSISWFNTKAITGDGITFRKIGKRRMYLKQDVLDWLEKNCPKMLNTMQYNT